MSNNLMVIGDVHGKTMYYKWLLDDHNGPSIQVGDFGFKREHEWHMKNIDPTLHKINFGNHDDTTFVHEKHSLGDSHYDKKLNLMTVRGAYSIDKHHRDEGRDWWRNEQISYYQMDTAIAKCRFHQPKIMVTHDCPSSIKEKFFGYTDKTLTNQGLQVMFEGHKPELWIFGHYHKSMDEVVDGTRFICLKELETIVI